jgi:hypothetical protein
MDSPDNTGVSDHKNMAPLPSVSPTYVPKTTLAKFGAIVAVPGAGVIGWLLSTMIDLDERVTKMEAQVERNTLDVRDYMKEADEWRDDTGDSIQAILLELRAK